jgi:hypothetical protein
MTKKSRKRRGGDIRTPDPITKQMLNEAIKQYSGKMVRVFREVEKILGIKTPVKDDAKLLKMFKEVTPREINRIKTIKTIKTIKQSGGAPPCPEAPTPASFQQRFSAPQKAELSRAYENIWNPYQVKDENNAGPDGFKCTANGWGDVGEDEIDCGCKTDPFSMECLTKDNLIESPGGACYSSTDQHGRGLLDLLYNGDPERGIAPNRRNPLTNAPWTPEELQWLNDVGIREVVDVVAIDRDDDVRERDFRAFEVRLDRVHYLHTRRALSRSRVL